MFRPMQPRGGQAGRKRVTKKASPLGDVGPPPEDEDERSFQKWSEESGRADRPDLGNKAEPVGREYSSGMRPPRSQPAWLLVGL